MAERAAHAGWALPMQRRVFFIAVMFFHFLIAVLFFHFFIAVMFSSLKVG